MLGRLYALAEHAYFQPLGDIDDVGQDRLVSERAFGIFVEKPFIQFKYVEIQFLPDIDPRIAGAEIVDGDAVSEEAQPVDQFFCARKVVEKDRLRQLELNELGRKGILRNDAVKGVRYIGVLGMQAGEIDGGAHDGQPLGDPFRQKAAHPAADEQVELRDGSARFHGR